MRGVHMVLAAAGAALACGAGRELRAADDVLIRVPADFPTIQAAVDAAPRSGRVVIRVSPGLYVESVSISGLRDLSFEGAGDDTVIAADAGPAVSIDRSRVTLSGFTLASHADDLDVGGDAVADVHDVLFAPCGSSAVHVQGIDPATMWASYGDPKGIYSSMGSHLTLHDCTIDSPRDDGIHADFRAALDVRDVEILSPGNDGIDAGGDDVGARVQNATVRDAGGVGVAIESVAASVEGCVVVGAGLEGIVVRGNGIVVADNWVSNSRGDGFVVAGLGAFVRHNHVSRAGRDGLRVACRQSLIEGNVSLSAAGDGLDLAGTTASRINGNTSAESGASGVRLGSSTANRLARNVASRSGEYDLYEDGGHNRISRSNRFPKRHRHRWTRG